MRANRAAQTLFVLIIVIALLLSACGQKSPNPTAGLSVAKGQRSLSHLPRRRLRRPLQLRRQ